MGREESDPTEHSHTQKLSNQKQRKKEFSLFLPFCNFEFRPMHMHYRFKKSNMILKYIRVKKRETSSRETSPLKRRQEARRGRSQAGPGTTVTDASTTDLKRSKDRNTASVRGHSRNSRTPPSVRTDYPSSPTEEKLSSPFLWWTLLQNTPSQLPLSLYKITALSFIYWASLAAQLLKNLPAMWETWVRSLGWEDPLEKGKATPSSIACGFCYSLLIPNCNSSTSPK